MLLMQHAGLLSVFWHRVESDAIPVEYLDGTNSTVSMFREHIKFLITNYTPVSITDFLNIVSNKDLSRSYDKPPVLLGFDDGFKSIITNALPVLNEFNVPAMFFVIGEILKNPDFVPWFIEMKHLIRKAKHKNIVYSNASLTLTSQQDCAKLKHLFEASYRTCRLEAERQRLLTHLANLVGVDRPVASALDEDLRFVDTEDLAHLSSSSLLTVASHAMTHRYLASLPYEEQLYELEQSDVLLRQHCPSYYPTIAYPGGSFNAATLAIVKRTYRAGFAVFLGASYRNLYAYPRLGINQDTVQELAHALNPTRLKYLRMRKRVLHITGIRRIH
jgi:peptidoglycan/xylan/chitin deacetylase (PgdA/CDA1 family)